MGPLRETGLYLTELARLSLDRAIAAIADRQHGVIGLAQLTALGLTPDAVRQRVRAGRLHPVHRGVYAVGHARLSARGRWMAAVLACGPGAALSHRSAAALIGIRETSRAAIDVTAPGSRGRGRTGIEVHSAATLAPADITVLDGIPSTSVARTLVDLAAVVAPAALARALEEAERLRLFDLAAVEAAAERAGNRPGLPALRHLLSEPGEPAWTRSELERIVLALCREAGLARPLVNHRLELADGLIEVDFCWPELRLVVETDGYRWHGTRAAFERDRDRDQRLAAAGWRIVRFTWRQVVEQPEIVVARLVAMATQAREPTLDNRRHPLP